MSPIYSTNKSDKSCGRVKLYVRKSGCDRVLSTTTGYCYLRAIPFHLHQTAHECLGLFPTNQELLNFIDQLDFAHPATFEFYHTARVQVSVQAMTAHLVFCSPEEGLPVTEALNLISMETRIGGHYEKALWTIGFFAPLLAQKIFFPSIYFLELCILLIIRTAQNNPWDLLPLAFASALLPQFPCPIMGPLPNNMQPVFFGWCLLFLRDRFIDFFDHFQPIQFINHQVIEPEFISVDSDQTISSSDETGSNWNLGPKSAPINSNKALLGDMYLDKTLPKMLKRIGAHHSQVGPLRDFLRGKKFQVAAGTKLNVKFPATISGNPPSLHTKSTLVERELINPSFHKEFLKLAELEAGAQLLREQFTVPIKDILTL